MTTLTGINESERTIYIGVCATVYRAFMISTLLTLFCAASASAQSMGSAYVYRDVYFSGQQIVGFTSISDENNSYQHTYWIENVTIRSDRTGRSASATSGSTYMYDISPYVRQDVYLPFLTSDIGDYRLTASPYFRCSYYGFTPQPFPPVLFRYQTGYSVLCYAYQGPYSGYPGFPHLYEAVQGCGSRVSCGNNSVYAAAFSGLYGFVFYPFLKFPAVSFTVCSPILEGSFTELLEPCDYRYCGDIITGP